MALPAIALIGKALSGGKLVRIGLDSKSFSRMSKTLGSVGDISSKKNPDLGGIASSTTSKMKSKVPVVSGNLKSKIKVNITKDGLEARSDAIYSKYVEYGTRYRGAKPFFRSAVKEMAKKIKESINKQFKKAFK